MTRYVLGLDVGGTHTRAAVVDESGQVLGIGVGGAGNSDGVGAETASQSVRDAIRLAWDSAGSVTLSAGFGGFAGVVTDDDRRVALDRLRVALPVDVCVDVDHDCRIALAGGLSGRPGIVLIAGTGASAFGRTATGREWRANGWGSVVGDEGGSYWIGVEGLRAAVRARDGRAEPTQLDDLLFSHLGITDPNDLLGRTTQGGLRRPEIAGLAPTVVQAAETGDLVARAIIERAVQELVLSVAAVHRRLEGEQALREIVLVGGLTTSALVENRLRTAVTQLLPGSVLARPELPPVLGAALLAIARLRSVEADALPASVVASLADSAQVVRLLAAGEPGSERSGSAGSGKPVAPQTQNDTREASDQGPSGQANGG